MNILKTDPLINDSPISRQQIYKNRNFRNNKKKYK